LLRNPCHPTAYKGEKSGGKAVADAKFTVRVIRSAATPVDSVRVSATFVRGPDNMWYLDQGTLEKTGRGAE
jgi:hypothetical protein